MHGPRIKQALPGHGPVAPTRRAKQGGRCGPGTARIPGIARIPGTAMARQAAATRFPAPARAHARAQPRPRAGRGVCHRHLHLHVGRGGVSSTAASAATSTGATAQVVQAYIAEVAAAAAAAVRAGSATPALAVAAAAVAVDGMMMMMGGGPTGARAGGLAALWLQALLTRPSWRAPGAHASQRQRAAAGRLVRACSRLRWRTWTRTRTCACCTASCSGTTPPAGRCSRCAGEVWGFLGCEVCHAWPPRYKGRMPAVPCSRWTLHAPSAIVYGRTVTGWASCNMNSASGTFSATARGTSHMTPPR